ncbi:MAG: diacylglycerol/lipid kinase family protein [Hyphomicrobiaceae bacterium]
MEKTYSTLTPSRCRRRRFRVIHNPTAGMRNRLRLRRVLEFLNEDGCEIVVRNALNLSENHALAKSARESDDFDAVVAAGGDGTVRAAAAALLDSNLPLGIIPLGAGSIMTHEIGLSQSADAIAICLLDRNVLSIPSGTANGVPFFLNGRVRIRWSRHSQPQY